MRTAGLRGGARMGAEAFTTRAKELASADGHVIGLRLGGATAAETYNGCRLPDPCE